MYVFKELHYFIFIRCETATIFPVYSLRNCYIISSLFSETATLFPLYSQCNCYNISSLFAVKLLHYFLFIHCVTATTLPLYSLRNCNTILLLGFLCSIYKLSSQLQGSYLKSRSLKYLKSRALQCIEVEVTIIE